MRTLKILNLIVVSLVLTIIVNCSSVKKQKSSYKETVADKKETVSEILSANQKDSVVAVNSVSSINTQKYENVLGIKYTPKFDINGILIPFTYTKKDNKGNTTEVRIEGPAEVTNTITDVSEKTVDSLQAYTDFRTDEVKAVVDSVKEQVDTLIQKDTFNKTVAPDYVKYLIWMAVFIGFLVLVIVGAIIYFKVTINKYKKLLNGIT